MWLSDQVSLSSILSTPQKFFGGVLWVFDIWDHVIFKDNFISSFPILMTYIIFFLPKIVGAVILTLYLNLGEMYGISFGLVICLYHVKVLPSALVSLHYYNETPEAH